MFTRFIPRTTTAWLGAMRDTQDGRRPPVQLTPDISNNFFDLFLLWSPPNQEP